MALERYCELHRQQFHFTAREKWINVPDGRCIQVSWMQRRVSANAV